MSNLIAQLEGLQCNVVEICEPHPGNPSRNIFPIERVKLIEQLKRPDLLPELRQARDYLWSSGNGAPYRNIPAETLEFLERLDAFLGDDKLEDGHYWFKSERSSTRSIAQLLNGQWYVIDEKGPITLEELKRRGWEVDEPVC